MLQMIRDYEAYLSEARGASANTQASYMRDIKLFSHYLEANDRSDLTGVSHDDVCAYLKWLKDEGKSIATVTRTTAGLKSFYNYLCSHGYMENNPVSSVKTDKSQRKMPQVLSGKEVNFLLEQPECTDAKGFRDRAMLELLYATGIRVSELISLNVSDVIMGAQFIKCTSHGRDRIIPIYVTAAQAIQTYIASARKTMLRNQNEQALFVNCNGERMTRQGFWKIIKQYQEKAHLGKEVTPQILRHTFATHLLENGADLQSIQMMMGHADISSTQVYASLIKQRINDVYQRAHPRAK